VTYGYDQQSRLTGITRGANTIGFGYDTPSRRTSMTYPNGVVTTYGYDTESHLTSLGASLSGTPITSFSYILDSVGNRTRKTTLDWAEDYGYDEVYRLKSADRSAGTPTRWRFAYDPAGNRTGDQTDDATMGATFNNVNELQARQPGGVLAFRGTTNEPASVTVAAKPAQTTSTNTFTAQTPVGAGTTDVAVAATDPAGNVRTNTYRATASGAGTTYAYDSNGNLATKTEGTDTWAYEWNARNELTRVTKNSVEQARFAYDPLGRRVEKIAGSVATGYTYDGVSILRETVAGTALKYVHGRAIDEPLAREDASAALIYYHADGLGSIVKRTDQSGAVVHQYRYGVWGDIELGATEPGYAFTGREWDPEIGLYYYRARYYAPILGGFISQDPIGLGGGLNHYAYVGGSPATYIDPEGLRATYRDGGTRTHCRSRDWLTINNKGRAAPAFTEPTVFVTCSCDKVCDGYQRNVDIRFSMDIFMACGEPQSPAWEAHEQKHVADWTSIMERVWRNAESTEGKTYSSKAMCEMSCYGLQLMWNTEFQLRYFKTEVPWVLSKP
jgi:RHS repeat-associated protein